LSDHVDDRLTRSAELLRSLRRRLDAFEAVEAPSGAEIAAWELDLYAYDEALVTAADVLDVPVPEGARDDLTPEHRAMLEAGLAAAGLDVRGGEG
jgi:hypothetical protein